jgi:hypothetical protein
MRGPHTTQEAPVDDGARLTLRESLRVAREKHSEIQADVAAPRQFRRFVVNSSLGALGTAAHEARAALADMAGEELLASSPPRPQVLISSLLWLLYADDFADEDPHLDPFQKAMRDKLRLREFLAIIEAEIKKRLTSRRLPIVRRQPHRTRRHPPGRSLAIRKSLFRI